MNDNDLLDAIADRAPRPTSDYTDRVLAAGRSARRRRRVALAGAVLCAVVAVAAPVTIWNADDGPEVTVVTNEPSGAEQAEAYRVVISAILSDAMPAAEIGGYNLVDRLCVNVLTPVEPCQAEPFPAGLRQRLTAVEHRQIRFVPPDDGVPEQGILITLGPIRFLDKDRAEVSVSFRQAAQEAVVRTYTFSYSRGSWVRIIPF